MMLLHRSMRGGAVAAAGSAPSAPSGLSATAVSSSQINLSWTDNSADETGFIVETSANGTSGWSVVTTTAANATSYSHTSLTASTAYYYRVKATNGYGDSAYTSVANDTTLAGGTALFTDDFASGDLSHTENGVAWGASNAGGDGDSVGVVSNQLQFVFAVGGDAWAEQRFTFGTTNAYPEIYGRLLLTLPSDFVPPGSNAKGLFTFWSNKYNNTDPGYEDGYSSSTELFIGNEMTPNGSGGCRGNIRITHNNYDINVQGGGAYLSSGFSLIASSDAGKTIEFVQRVKSSTVDGTHGNLNEDFIDTTPGLNGAFQIWKRIPAETSTWTLVVDKTAMNAYPPADWNGFNRGYILGWVNGGFSTAQTWLVDGVQFSTSDIWGIT